MLVKKPKPPLIKWVRRIAGVAFVAEAIAFAVTYYGWTKVNQDRGEPHFSFPRLFWEIY